MILIRNIRGLRGFGARTVILGTGVFLVLALIIHLLMTNYREGVEQTRRESVSRELSTLAAHIQLELSANVFLANGMVAYITAVKNPSEAGFEKAMAALFHFGRHLRNIGVAPDNRIRYVYPPHGNENIVGLYYPDLPQQWPAVQAAIASKETVLAGPLLLRQGGLGLISRTPVFLENGDYWGILSLVLDADHVLKLAEVAQNRGDTEFAIRGRDGAGANGAVFWGNGVLFSEEAIIVDVPVPGGTWQIAGIPQQGWSAFSTASRLLEIGGLAIAALIAIVMMGYHRGQRELTASRNRLAAFTGSTHDGVLIVGPDDRIRETNPAAERLLGRSAGEIVNMPLADLLTPDSEADNLMRGHRPDGSLALVEPMVGTVTLENEPLRLFSLRDVGERIAAEAALRESEQTFRHLASQVPGVIYRWIERPDGSHGFTYVSPRAADILHQAPEALIADWTLFGLHPDDVDLWQESMSRSLASLSDWEFVGRLLRDNEVRWWHAHSRPERLADGSTLYTGVLIDITEEKRTELALADTERELSSILEHVVDGVITIDETGTIHAFNLAAERIFGYTADEACGRNITMIMTPDLTEAHTKGMQRYLETNEARIIGNGTVTVPGRRKDGTTLPLDLSLSETTTTRGRLFTGIMRDATERVRHETELEDSRAAMERRAATLATLAEELEIARREAEEASRAKSRFLAVMSHELRTPLTGVLGTADLLLGSDLDPRQTKWTRALKRSGEGLLHLLDDILDYSKVEAGHLAIEHVAFDPIEPMREVVQLFRSRAREKGVTLEWQDGAKLPEFVSGDPTRLRQVLLNLVGNAVKFTAKGRIVTRIASAEPVEGERLRLCFEISDTGVGMTEAEIARLFQPFSQADASTTRRYGGTGLGLAICKNLAELMGGEIGCASAPGEGSTFWFSVVVEAGAIERPIRDAADQTPKPPARCLDVLVAEDNEINRMLLCETLERQGHRVVAVEDGSLAVAALRQRRFDILLIDKQMPVMDGVEASRAIRAAEAEPGTLPIVMLTADILTEHDDDHHTLISATLGKPIDWVRLAATMDELCADGTSVEPEPASTSGLAVLSRQMLSELPAAKQASILRMLTEKLAASLAEMETALRDEDSQAVRRVAHSLVGMASQTGLERVADEGRRILERDKTQPADPTATCRLGREIAAANSAISDRIAELDGV